jgi:hypothetical protein
MGFDEGTARGAVVEAIVEVNTRLGEAPAAIEKWCARIAPYNVKPFYTSKGFQRMIRRAFERNGRGREYRDPNSLGRI